MVQEGPLHLHPAGILGWSGGTEMQERRRKNERQIQKSSGVLGDSGREYAGVSGGWTKGAGE